MLKIDKKDEEIIVIFNPITEIKRAFTFFLCFFIVLNAYLYFIQKNPEPLLSLKYSLASMLIVLLFSLCIYDKTEIYFKRLNIEIYRNFYGIKKLKISLKYFEIKSMENISLGGRRGNELLIKDTANFKHSIVGSFLEKELDEIIKIYENDVKEMLNRIALKDKLENSIQEVTLIYNLALKNRYQEILKKIIEEEKFYISQIGERVIINGSKTAIENLEILKNMEWEEINFYNFYVNYLSKKENENKIVLVGYNGIDGKEVTMSILKDDINEIRDSKSTFKD